MHIDAGKAYEQGKFAEAAPLFLRAAGAAEVSGFPKNAASSYESLADCFLEIGQHEAALEPARAGETLPLPCVFHCRFG